MASRGSSTTELLTVMLRPLVGGQRDLERARALLRKRAQGLSSRADTLGERESLSGTQTGESVSPSASSAEGELGASSRPGTRGRALPVSSAGVRASAALGTPAHDPSRAAQRVESVTREQPSFEVAFARSHETLVPGWHEAIGHSRTSTPEPGVALASAPTRTATRDGVSDSHLPTSPVPGVAHAPRRIAVAFDDALDRRTARALTPDAAHTVPSAPVLRGEHSSASAAVFAAATPQPAHTEFEHTSGAFADVLAPLAQSGGLATVWSAALTPEIAGPPQSDLSPTPTPRGPFRTSLVTPSLPYPRELEAPPTALDDDLEDRFVELLLTNAQRHGIDI